MILSLFVGNRAAELGLAAQYFELFNWFQEDDPVNHLISFDARKRPRSLYFGSNSEVQKVWNNTKLEKQGNSQQQEQSSYEVISEYLREVNISGNQFFNFNLAIYQDLKKQDVEVNPQVIYEFQDSISRELEQLDRCEGFECVVQSDSLYGRIGLKVIECLEELQDSKSPKLAVNLFEHDCSVINKVEILTKYYEMATLVLPIFPDARKLPFQHVPNQIMHQEEQVAQSSMLQQQTPQPQQQHQPNQQSQQVQRQQTQNQTQNQQQHAGLFQNQQTNQIDINQQLACLLANVTSAYKQSEGFVGLEEFIQRVVPSKQNNIFNLYAKVPMSYDREEDSILRFKQKLVQNPLSLKTLQEPIILFEQRFDSYGESYLMRGRSAIPKENMLSSYGLDVRFLECVYQLPKSFSRNLPPSEEEDLLALHTCIFSNESYKYNLLNYLNQFESLNLKKLNAQIEASELRQELQSMIENYGGVDAEVDDDDQ